MAHRRVDDLRWWQRGVIYQVWLRSFYDTDGNGNGDLRGVLEKLDYFEWLGIDVLWLSPVYPSPLVESGYDVTDFTSVHEMLGSLEDLDELIARAHERDIRILLDFVPNHTSDAHPWFVESRSSRDNPKRAWYLWAEPKEDGSPPNNWAGCFGGSAWTFDKETGQYYYHAFLAQQPDLDWRNADVQRAISDTIRFWLGRGIDGLRMDAIWHLIKDDQLRDNPPNPDFTPDLPPDNVVHAVFTRDRPEVHDVIVGLRNVFDEFDDRLLAGELYLGLDRMMEYYGTPERPELHLPLNLQLSVVEWNATTVATFVEDYEAALPEHAWPNWSIGTHDSNRIASRAGDEQARNAAMLLLLLRGTPTIYYGDEIGMHSADVPRGSIVDLRELLTPYIGLGRDPARTPMHWNAEPNAGFTQGTPWLPLGDDWPAVNVNAQSGDPGSLLELYRALLALRKSQNVFVIGRYATVHRTESLFVFRRDQDDAHALVALNFGGEPARIALPQDLAGARILLSTKRRCEGTEVAEFLELDGNEGVALSKQDA